MHGRSLCPPGDASGLKGGAIRGDQEIVWGKLDTELVVAHVDRGLASQGSGNCSILSLFAVLAVKL